MLELENHEVKVFKKSNNSYWCNIVHSSCRQDLAEARKVLDEAHSDLNKATSDVEKAEAQIAVEVAEELIKALQH